MLDNGTVLAARPFDLKLERHITMEQANEIQSFALPEETRARMQPVRYQIASDTAQPREASAPARRNTVSPVPCLCVTTFRALRAEQVGSASSIR
jgi:hypothetical protein